VVNVVENCCCVQHGHVIQSCKAVHYLQKKVEYNFYGIIADDIVTKKKKKYANYHDSLL
jgi:hypothetical protein